MSSSVDGSLTVLAEFRRLVGREHELGLINGFFEQIARAVVAH